MIEGAKVICGKIVDCAPASEENTPAGRLITEATLMLLIEVIAGIGMLLSKPILTSILDTLENSSLKALEKRFEANTDGPEEMTGGEAEIISLPWSIEETWELTGNRLIFAFTLT